MTDLLVLLHGRGADEQDLLPIAALVAPGALVLGPRAPFPFGPGWAWAPTDDDPVAGQGLDRAAEDVLARLDAAAPAGRVLLLGFSQGAGVAVEMLRRQPERFDRTALVAAFVPSPDRVDPATAAVRPAVFWGRGELDPLFSPSDLAGARRWLEAHTALTARSYPGLGHGIDEAELADVAAFLRADPTA